MEFRVSRLDDSSVFGLYLSRDEIWRDPPYQRMADIWPLEKKQLLVDSLLNGFDVPKFYFHDFYPGESVDGREVRFAIIDGKQRLSAIWDFIDGKFPLSQDIELLNQPSVDIRGLTYGELGAEHPRLKATLDARHLTVITIQTTDVELIEEMFSRLKAPAHKARRPATRHAPRNVPANEPPPTQTAPERPSTSTARPTTTRQSTPNPASRETLTSNALLQDPGSYGGASVKG